MSRTRTFGAFFRERRGALKVGLREFCRLNGFDPGNVSRMERGLALPPLAEDVLKSYAGALKLKPKTDDWERFFNLASAETGRIPPHLLENKKDAERLSTVFEQLKGQRHANWARAVDLEAWADYLDARSQLPQLVRRLINATLVSAIRMSIPSGEGVQRPGWDGLVETTKGNAFVPEGTSVWELSVDKDPHEKAEKDFGKRSKNTAGLDPSQATLVFVTARKWDKKSEWCRQKNELRIWKDVRFYDSADLEEWLELAPAVDLWFATLRGQRQPGVTDLDEHWAGLAALSSPALTPEVFLTSREKGVADLKKWLEGEPAALEVVAGSGAEVIDFFAAYLRTLPREDLEAFSARAIIVEKREAWQALSASKNPLILIPHPSFAIDPETVGAAVRRGHYVLVGSDGIPAEREPLHRLARVDRYELEKVLISSGIDRMQAEKYAREAGGSLTVLKRLLARFPGTDYPAWSRAPDSLSLLPVLLAGQWDESYEGDRTILERLAERPYDQVVETAGRWLTERDTPLVQALSCWRLVSREDSWFLLAPSITAQYLNRLESVVLVVLIENDPKFELPPNERWKARVHGKALTYSGRLRTGVSETLAILGGKGKRVPRSANAEGFAERVVRKLLEGADWVRWASLADQLPLLAEAAPEAFLEAVLRDLRGREPILKKLLEQEGDAIFSTSPHTRLLWALESLAWEASYLPRVTSILTHLSELDPPEARLANRPLNCLREIYLTWYPRTSASVEKRIEVLDSLKKRHEAVWWKLLLKLLPSPMDTSIATYRPRWRDWAVGVAEGATTGEYWLQAEAYARRLVENAGTNVARWKELLRVCERFPGPIQSEFLARLKELDPMSFSPEARRELAEALRRKEQWVRGHSVFKDLPSVRERFEPEDLIARNAWLFGSHWEVRDALEGEGNQEEGSEDRVAILRRDALKAILATQGMEGILRLVDVASSPREVGVALGAITGSEHDTEILPSFLASEKENVVQFARGYVESRFSKNNWNWIEKLPSQGWSTQQLGEIGLVLPFERRNWEFVQKRGDVLEEYYWSRVRDIYGGDDARDVEFAVSRLLQYKQPLQALHVLAMAIYKETPVPNSLMLDSLQKTLESKPDSHRRDRMQHDIHQLFTRLQTVLRETSDESLEKSLAILEWRYLALLDGHPASPQTLYRALQREPKFFVDLLALVFRSRDEPRELNSVVSDEEKARAENAYRLLTSWRHLLPGRQEDGSVDEEELTTWVRRARELAQESGRIEICDSRLGELLADAPEEADGSWPCVAVRDVLEEVGTEELLRGFEIGIYNKRGMYSKSPSEGGVQERALAEKYRDYTRVCEIEWPTTAASLRRVAEHYDNDARREDASVELEL